MRKPWPSCAAFLKTSNPSLVEQHIVWSLFNLGRKEEASAALEELLKNYQQENRGLFISVQAVLTASAGQERLAEEKVKLALEAGKGFGHFHHTAYYVACAYALMNQPEQALKWLDAAADDGFPCYPLFEKDPNLNNLRQDPASPFSSRSRNNSGSITRAFCDPTRQ